MLLPLIVWLSCMFSANAQFAEIASLATSLIGPALSGAGIAGAGAGAAAQAGGALAQIGQLYQLAQGALQLTGTGVGVLNQASEGNWFPAILEQTAKNNEQLRQSGGGIPSHGGLGGLGGLGGGLPGLPGLGPLAPSRPKASGTGGLGPEFGTTPDVDDYDDKDLTKIGETPKPSSPFGSEIEEKSGLPETTTASTTSMTLFPEEEISATTLSPQKQIRIELPKSTDEDYIDQVTKEGGAQVQITTKSKEDGDESLLGSNGSSGSSSSTGDKKGVPDLTKLISTLRDKSHLTEEEIMEIVNQVENNGRVEKPPKIDFGSSVQNIGEQKAVNRQRIIEASRRIATSQQGVKQEVDQRTDKLKHVTLPPSTIGTTAPFVVTTPIPTTKNVPRISPDQLNQIQSNRLQREIMAQNFNKDTQPVTNQKFEQKPPQFVQKPLQPQPQPQPQPQLPPRPNTVPQYNLQQQQIPGQQQNVQQPQQVYQQVQQPYYQLHNVYNPWTGQWQQQYYYTYNTQQVQQPPQQQQYQQQYYGTQQQGQAPQQGVQYQTQQQIPQRPQNSAQQQRTVQQTPYQAPRPQQTRPVYQQPAANVQQMVLAARTVREPSPVNGQASKVYTNKPGVQFYSGKTQQGTANVQRGAVTLPDRTRSVGSTGGVQNQRAIRQLHDQSVRTTHPPRPSFIVTPTPPRRFPARTARPVPVTTESPMLRLPFGIESYGTLLVNRNPETIFSRIVRTYRHIDQRSPTHRIYQPYL